LHEVKALGVPMGTPVFKWGKVLREHNVLLSSPNFSVYTHMSKVVPYATGDVFMDALIA